jgi:Fibronectin type III domain
MMIVFIIYSTVPPSPRNVMVETSLSNSLMVVWDSPHPPHGVITGYTLKYSLMDHDGSRNSQNSIDLEPTIHRYNITDLEPNSTYTIQVQVARDVA